MFPLTSFDFTGRVDNRLPTVSASLSLTLIVFVILTGQVVLYFWKPPVHTRDRLWVKGIVVFIWMIQAAGVALSSHSTALAHSHDFALGVEIATAVREWVVYTGMSVVTECLVHAYFISRIYLLETNPIYARISTMLCIALVLEGSFGFVSMSPLILTVLRSSRHVASSWTVPLWLGLSIFVDISIAGSMFFILKKGKPYLSLRLSLLIKRIIRFSIQTGLITSLATGTTVALWIVARLDLGHLMMTFPTGGIYATCFMANLIARESYFNPMHMDESSECFEIAAGNIEFAINEGLEKNESVSLSES